MYNENEIFERNRDSIKMTQKSSYSNVSYNNSEDNNREEPGSYFVDAEAPFVKFPMFDQFDFIRHGFSTRLGGVSQGMFQTMNLSYNRGDRKEDVTENYRRICLSMDMKPEDIVFSDQVHDTKIHVASKQDCQGTDYGNRKLTGIDGLITREKDVILCTSYADCVPLFFVDARNHAIGASHSGWKGTVGKIGAKTVEKMRQEFGTKPEDLYCVIGPSICVDCYEVSKDVIDQIKDNFREEVVEQCVFAKDNGKYQLDLWMLNQNILLEAGVPRKQIAVSNLCTCCNHTLLFSHRASSGKRGNLCGFLSLT